ncbi:WW domain-containing protein [Toxocara canis]|uniref:WW domain-containing protein n=1 Tax=Toxocara canis TaxID=6265 RepID=A0A0B2V7J8_TOXCA|nr:WW domain-containing protein [Toxocara canis]
MTAPTAMAHTSSDHCFISTSLPKFPTQDIDEQVMDVGREELEMACRRSVDNAESYYEEEHVYANVREMEEESRRIEQPPTPDVTERPIRDLGNGWLEYLTETGRRSVDNAESYYEEEHVYANVREMEEESRRIEQPPTPDVTERPIRDLGNGWLEYLTETGRSYFFNPETGDCRWKPPRFLKPPSQICAAFNGATGLYDNVVVPIADVHTREDDSVASCSAPVSPLIAAKSLTDMVESVDSGIGRTSISVRNKVIDKIAEKRISMQAVSRELAKRVDAFKSSEELAAAEVAHLAKNFTKFSVACFQLELIDGTIYQFSTANSQDINGWFHALRHVISKLPRPDAYPTPVLERVNVASGVSRSPSSLSHSHSSSPFGNTPARHSTKKGKTSSKDAMTSSTVDDGRAGASSGSGTTEVVPTRESIIEKLRRFFRSRPSIDSLKEKGIYRPEPVFGSTLQAICQHEHSTVPRFIHLVTEVIESRGLDTDGLYRVSGNLSAIQKIRCHVDQEKYEVLVREEDVHVLTGALKLFFRELSEPIFPINLAKDFIHANRLPNGENKVKAFDELLRKLPLVNRETLKVLFGHLLKVANHADKNRMEIHNLAIMFGPSLFSSGLEPSSDGKKGSVSKKKASEKKLKERPTVQSNSHLAFNMIMQGQTVEYLLKEFRRFPILQGPTV